MRKTSKTEETIVSEPKEQNINQLEIDKILGECHDGEDYKILLKDGSVKIVPKLEIDKK